jgi:hypothetical protein
MSEVWGVNAGSEIFRLTGRRWQKIGGSLRQISVGNARDIWGVNAGGEIFSGPGGVGNREKGGSGRCPWGVTAKCGE